MEKDFIVYITETLQRKVRVSATSDSEAYTKALEMYDSGEIVLDSSDYEDMEIVVRGGNEKSIIDIYNLDKEN